MTTTVSPRHFASDNNAGICPEVFAALAEANGPHAPGYGDDPWTRRAEDLFREVFETECEVFFVFNGTASNCLALWSLCDSFHGVICHRHSHIETDECGAPGFFMHGVTLIPTDTADGKLTPATVRAASATPHDFHGAQPRAVSLTQATELGTVYTPDELGALSAVARELKLAVHMDGARFANAVASLRVSPADLTWRAGVDVLSFGGTKNGAQAGESVVFFDRARADNFRRRCKQSGQLASKMRFLSAQWVGLLEGGAWLRHAGHANDIAAYLERRLEGLPGVRVAFPRQANAVFASLPKRAADAVAARGWRFYNDVGPGGAARLMCSWDSTTGDVDAFIGDLATALSETSRSSNFPPATSFPMATPDSRHDALAELIALAREATPYYHQAYAGLPAQPELAALPVVDPDAYWQAHATDRRNILTQTQQDGIVLNSSGTSGTPKFSYVAAEEWAAGIDLSARSFDAAGMRDGDRVVTLFATGSLYASLLFATDSLKRIRARVVQFPVGYSTAFAETAKVIETFAINVLAGFPTHILRVIDALKPESDGGVRIDHLIYAGELFTPDQQQSLLARYPGLQIHSAGYASVEGGPIGYADAGCTASEHRVYDGGTILEILDEETSAVIEETGRPGRIVFTCLGRRLMPLIRYPTGDRAQWVEPTGSPDRKFLLLGRAGQTVRVARYNLDLSEVAASLESVRAPLGIEHFQIVVARQDLLDRLIFRLVGRASPETLSEGTTEILNLFRQKRPDIQKAVEAGILHPTQVEWIRQDQLITNERSGKMLAVVDRRNA